MLNKVELMGYFVRSPELRMTQTGTAVTSFALAVNRDYKAESQDRECDFIDCVAWKSAAEFVCKYFKKGSMIALVGRLSCRDWTDKDGNRRKSTEVIVENIYFFGSKNDMKAPAGEGGRTKRRTEEPQDTADSWNAVPSDDEDLPF